MQTAKDIMTKDVISVDPETPLIQAVNIFLKHNFNGLPVTTPGGYLVGILTEYNLIIKGTSIHLPTFMKLFQQLDLYKKDSKLIKDDLSKIMNLKVKDVMDSNVQFLEPDDDLFKVVGFFSENQNVNPAPVVDKNKVVIGIISRYDLLKFMGDKNIDIGQSSNDVQLEKNINSFINNFDKKFIIVSKNRTRWWLIASILFAIVGFIVAYASVLRVNF